MGKGPSLSRRRFINYASSASFFGLCQSPAVALFTTILGGQSQRAWADSLGIQPRNFVDITENGAPPRWMFDVFLTPYSSVGFNPSPMVGTKFRSVNGRYVGVEYATVETHGINAPYMWSHGLPTSDGGYRPMSDLLSNLLCIQGVTTRSAGHGGSQLLNQLPLGALKSTSAMSADASNAPFAAINVNASSFTFKSTESKTAISLSPVNNMLTSLLDAFRPAGSSPFRTNRDSIHAAYDSILPALDDLARAGHPGAESLILNRRAALELASTNFAALDSQWAALLAKYRSLISRAIYDPTHLLAGVNDAPIGEGGTGDPLMYQIGDQSQLNLHLATDLRSAIDSRTTISNLAECFAFTDYVLRNRLSSSIAFGYGLLGPFVRQSDGVARESLVNDQHGTGLYPATYFNILRHRAVAACLMELISQLTANNLFNDTVIRIGGEFTRVPRMDMRGSDHGFTGQRACLYSGAFNGPLIIGNLANDRNLGWGSGGPISQLNRQLNLNDVAVTIAHCLRVPPPLTSSTSLVTVGTNGLVSNIGRTTYVT